MKLKNIINSVMAMAAMLFSFNISATEPAAKSDDKIGRAHV